MARDFTKAREKSRAAADAAVGDRLDEITRQADELEGIFDELKLTDKETYDGLIKIVEQATKKNESIASVIDNLKSLGQAGIKLAGVIGNITSGGSVSALRAALKLPKKNPGS